MLTRDTSEAPVQAPFCTCRSCRFDTCLVWLTWEMRPFLAVTDVSGVEHVSHVSWLTSECDIYALVVGVS